MKVKVGDKIVDVIPVNHEKTIGFKDEAGRIYGIDEIEFIKTVKTGSSMIKTDIVPLRVSITTSGSIE